MKRLVLVVSLLGLATQAWADARPQIVVEPPALELPGSGGSGIVRVWNRGERPLALTRVSLTADSAGFSLTDPGPRTIAPGQSVEVPVRYTAEGARKQAFGAAQLETGDGRTLGVALRAGSSWLLSAMIFTPLLGALLLLLVPGDRHRLIRLLALVTAAVPMALAVKLVAGFDRSFGVASGNHGLQFVEHVVWIPSFNVEYFVGVDGLSVTMMVLTALVSLIAVGASFGITKQVKAYFALFLLLETGMLGTFAALDFFLFYVFWEVMLLPMYFLIGIWGGPRKEYAAIKFFLYTLAGSVLMLLAVIALYYHSAPTTLVDGTPARHTFDVMKLTYLNDYGRAAPLLGVDFAKLVWLALFIGFAIKIPMFPFHTWLPDAHVEAPTAISVILAGVLLKMGVYGILRMNYGILPGASQWAGPALAAFGAINILYGAFCAFAQRDLKRLVAYSSVSHMGYCLVGIAAFTETGMSGAVVQMFNHGIITSMLFLLVGVLYDRAHTREIGRFGGVATQMPRYAAFFGLAFMASLGLPGLSGFIGEFLVFVGAFPVYRVITILACTGVVFTAAYHLWALQRVQLGRWNEVAWPERAQFPDLTVRETLTLVPLAALVVVLGFWPLPVLELIGRGLGDLLQHVRP